MVVTITDQPGRSAIVSTALSLYQRFGVAPVLLRQGSKRPFEKGWQEKAWSEETIRRIRHTGNIGLRCGDNNLIDIDPDAPEAIIAANAFLPETAMCHGRHTNPGNHRWYQTPAPMPRMTFEDPIMKADNPDNTAAMLIEIRGAGAQTMIPPSIHEETGRPLVWGVPFDQLRPAEVETAVLYTAVARAAACALVGRYWPRKGARHDFALALAGTLLRHGWDIDGAILFVQTAGQIAGDEETLHDRTRAVTDTRAALAKGEKATGLPTLRRYLDARVIDSLCAWLAIEGRDDPAASRVMLLVGSQPVEQSIAGWKVVLDDAPVDTDLLPHHLSRLVVFVQPKMRMWPTDWHVATTLAFWSALWPRVRVENLNLALWVLGIGRQGSGKNLGPDEIARLQREIARDITWPAGTDSGETHLKFFTSGSPQGLLDMIDGDGVPVMWYMREFSSMLQQFHRSDFMAGMREALCNIYDGMPDSFARAHGKGSNPTNTHLSAFVTTNKQSIVTYTTIEEMTGGMMSRFLPLASDYVEIMPSRFLLDLDVRRGLSGDLVDHLTAHRNVRRVRWETGDSEPEILTRFATQLGVGTGEIVDLDDDDDDYSRGPAGRFHAQTKKVAALLELAERVPLLADDRTVVVRECNVELAIAIVQRHWAYSERIRGWVLASADTRNAQRVLAWLHKHGGWKTLREVLQGTKLKKAEAEPALDLLVKDGRVAINRDNGRETFSCGVPARAGKGASS